MTTTTMTEEDDGDFEPRATDDDDNEPMSMSLRPQIYFPGVICRNEDVVGSGASILKMDKDRFSIMPSLCSPPDDSELLLHVPFMETVVIHSILVGRRPLQQIDEQTTTTSPARILKVFVDRDDIDFEMARVLPAQAVIELPSATAPSSTTTTTTTRGTSADEGEVGDIHVSVGLFHNVSSVTLFFASIDEVTYVGFHGESTHMQRVAVKHAIHESQSRLERHEVHKPGVRAQEGMGF